MRIFKEEQKFTELDYIMDNFEDVNFDDIKNLDFVPSERLELNFG